MRNISLFNTKCCSKLGSPPLALLKANLEQLLDLYTRRYKSNDAFIVTIGIFEHESDQKSIIDSQSASRIL